MYRDGNRPNFRSSRFTAHAAVLLQRKYNKSASRCNDKTDCQQLEVLSYEDYNRLKHLVSNTFPRCNINMIHRVNAPHMYGMYLLRKEEIQSTSEFLFKEMVLYHVTTKSRAINSLKSGLDWRRTRRSKFGRGVSFSDDADYANYYANNFPKEDSRVIIVCSVLVNETHLVSGKCNGENLMIPLGTADTTVSTNGHVYVKYNDYDFYPLYLIYYQQTPELINESKYFRNNPNNRRQQNHQLAQQRELQAQRHRELQAKRELEQARQELQAQRYLEQDQARQRQVLEQKRRCQVLLEQKRRCQVLLEQELHQQVQAPRPQDQTRRHERSNNCLIL